MEETLTITDKLSKLESLLSQVSELANDIKKDAENGVKFSKIQKTIAFNRNDSAMCEYFYELISKWEDVHFLAERTIINAESSIEKMKTENMKF